MTVKTAGMALREDLDAALTRAGRETGRNLEFDERERQRIDWAAKAADRAEQLGKVYVTELAGDKRASVLVKLSAEIRALHRAAAELLAKVDIPGTEKQKSARHVAAGKARMQALVR